MEREGGTEVQVKVAQVTALNMGVWWLADLDGYMCQTQVWKQSEEGLLRPKNQVKLHFNSELCRRLKIGKKYVFSLDPAPDQHDVTSLGGYNAVWRASGPPLTHSSRCSFQMNIFHKFCNSFEIIHIIFTICSSLHTGWIVLFINISIINLVSYFTSISSSQIVRLVVCSPFKGIIIISNLTSRVKQLRARLLCTSCDPKPVLRPTKAQVEIILTFCEKEKVCIEYLNFKSFLGFCENWWLDTFDLQVKVLLQTNLMLENNSQWTVLCKPLFSNLASENGMLNLFAKSAKCWFVLFFRLSGKRTGLKVDFTWTFEGRMVKPGKRRRWW